MALVDAYGVPYQPRDLPAGLDVFWQWPQIDSLTGWDVATAKGAADSHDGGDFTVSARMFWAMLSDERIADGLSKLGLALQQVKVRVVPGKGQRAKTVANKLRDLMGLDEDCEQVRPSRIFSPEVTAELLAMAKLMGEGVAQPEWDGDHDDAPNPVLQRPWFVPCVRTWEPALTRWVPGPYYPITGSPAPAQSYPGQLVALVRGSQKETPSFQVPIVTGGGQWVLFKLAGDRRLWLHGAIRTLWRPWISRLMARLLWLRFNDVHGLPIREIRVPMGMRKTPETQAFYDQIKNIGRDAAILSPQQSDAKLGGVQLGLIEAKSESWKSLQAMLTDYGREITISLTGGTQNAEAEGGNYKGAEEQREIRHEVKAAIARAWWHMFNDQIARPFATLNGYAPDEAPSVVPDTRPPPNRKADAEADAAGFVALQQAATAVTLMRAAGYEVTVPDLLASRGLTPPPGKVVEVEEQGEAEEPAEAEE